MEVSELLQFHFSHFNEKARWAFDWKGVPHTRRSLLPGPHMATTKRLTGQNEVPVVRFADGPVLHGSARIIDELERRHPEPALYPADPDGRREALEIQAHFDDVVGPRVRRALFSVMLAEPGYLCEMFATGKSWPVRRFYRGTFPLVKSLMSKGMGIDDAEAVREAFQATGEALDIVARRAGPSGQLVGDAFSVADLAAASLLAPVANPPGPSMGRPEPQPEVLQEWHARWQEHPGARWVCDQYRRHRPASAETARGG